jgi:hypothetical protein
MSKRVYGETPSQRSHGCRKSTIKATFICLSDIRSIIHFESVNQTFYVEVLKRLIDAVRRKRGELWTDRSSLFTTTMRRHILRFKCRSSEQEKASLPWIIRRTLLTWLQLTSGCFQNSKSVLKGNRFSDIDDIK